MPSLNYCSTISFTPCKTPTRAVSGQILCDCNSVHRISIMMLIGFGYLMTFLMYGGLSAVGFTFLITMLSVQTDILAEVLPINFRCLDCASKQGFFKCVYDGEWSTLHLSLMDLVLGNCAAAACLISFGGLIGKAGMQCLAPFMILEVTLSNSILCPDPLTTDDLLRLQLPSHFTRNRYC